MPGYCSRHYRTRREDSSIVITVNVKESTTQLCCHRQDLSFFPLWSVRSGQLPFFFFFFFDWLLSYRIWYLYSIQTSLILVRLKLVNTCRNDNKIKTQRHESLSNSKGIRNGGDTALFFLIESLKPMVILILIIHTIAQIVWKHWS